MKANNYQKLGLMLTDLTDAFKFAYQATDDSDKNEMTEQEFAQCLLFTQARYMARKAPEANVLTGTNRPPFDLSSNVAAQLGPFFVALCGSKLIVQGGSTGKQITEVFLRTPLPSRPSSAEDGASGAEAEDGGLPTRHIPDDDEEENAKPITQREMNAFIQEMRQIFTRLSKRTKANRYLERVIAASKGGLNPMPSKSEQDMRSRLTIEFRSVRARGACALLQPLLPPCAWRAFFSFWTKTNTILQNCHTRHGRDERTGQDTGQLHSRGRQAIEGAAGAARFGLSRCGRGQGRRGQENMDQRRGGEQAEAVRKKA
jgi:hypothetical protein